MPYHLITTSKPFFSHHAVAEKQTQQKREPTPNLLASTLFSIAV